MSEQAKVSDVLVESRFRVAMGDIATLASSMARLGQLQPIGIDGNGKLLFGARRLEAAKRLGWTTIAAVRFDGFPDALNRMVVELAENTCRKDFTPIEALTLAKAIEKAEKPRAAERKAATQAGSNRDRDESGKVKTGPANFAGPEPGKGETRQKAAAAVGYSRETLRKIEVVAEAAEKDPETFGPVAETMDRTGKVDPAYRAVKNGTTAKKRHTAKSLAANKPTPKPVPVAPSPSAAAGWAEIIEAAGERIHRAAADYQRQHPYGRAPLPEVAAAVRREMPSLTIGQFHDAVRALVIAGRLRWHPFTGPAFQLEGDEWAIVAGQEIKFYVAAA